MTEQEIREWVGPRIEKEADVKAVQIFNPRAFLFQTNRAMHALLAEIDRLRADIDRHLAIATEHINEIDRLRADRDDWRRNAEHSAALGIEAGAEINRLRAAFDRANRNGVEHIEAILRLCAALQTLSDDRYCTKHCPTTIQTGRRFHFAECAVAIARAALKDEG